MSISNILCYYIYVFMSVCLRFPLAIFVLVVLVYGIWKMVTCVRCLFILTLYSDIVFTDITWHLFDECDVKQEIDTHRVGLKNVYVCVYVRV